MQEKSYEIPKAYRVILKSLRPELNQFQIASQSFLEYCLAVFLLALSKYRAKMFDDDNAKLLEHLIKKNKYEIIKASNDFDILIGLMSAEQVPSSRIKTLEIFVNYFSMYQSLKKKNYLTVDDGETIYGIVCDRLKELRQEVRVPLRLEQRARSNSQGSGNGLLINVEVDDEFGDLNM